MEGSRGSVHQDLGSFGSGESLSFVVLATARAGAPPHESSKAANKRWSCRASNMVTVPPMKNSGALQALRTLSEAAPSTFAGSASRHLRWCNVLTARAVIG